MLQSKPAIWRIMGLAWIIYTHFSHHASFIVANHGVVASRQPLYLCHLKCYIQTVGQSVCAWGGRAKQAWKKDSFCILTPAKHTAIIFKRTKTPCGHISDALPSDVSIRTSTSLKIPRRSNFCLATWAFFITCKPRQKQELWNWQPIFTRQLQQLQANVRQSRKYIHRWGFWHGKRQRFHIQVDPL